jgi:hypothetical protein
MGSENPTAFGQEMAVTLRFKDHEQFSRTKMRQAGNAAENLFLARKKQRTRWDSNPGQRVSSTIATEAR